MHTFTWYGHSNFKVESSGTIILIDPFFTGNPKAPAGPEIIEKADIILVTHDHGDHLGDTLAIQKNTGALVVGIFELITFLQGEGLPEEKAMAMNIGGSVDLDGIRVQMTQAVHSAGHGSPVGFMVTLKDGFRFYHAGDTAFFSEMLFMGKHYKLDLAMLPIDGHYNMGAEEAALACQALACKRVMAMHWGTFPILAQSTENFEKALRKRAKKTLFTPMEIGMAVELKK